MRYCEFDNCTQSVFGTDKNTRYGYCKRHQYLRTDRKPKKIAPRTSKEKVHEISFGFDSQIEMFQALWEQARDERGIVTCPFTKERLNSFYNTELWYSCFAHVLPKGRYTYWKLNPDNIRVVFPDFHFYVDQKTLESRKRYPTWNFSLWDEEVEKLKLLYQIFKKERLLS